MMRWVIISWFCFTSIAWAASEKPTVQEEVQQLHSDVTRLRIYDHLVKQHLMQPDDVRILSIPQARRETIRNKEALRQARQTMKKSLKQLDAKESRDVAPTP